MTFYLLINYLFIVTGEVVLYPTVTFLIFSPTCTVTFCSLPLFTVTSTVKSVLFFFTDESEKITPSSSVETTTLTVGVSSFLLSVLLSDLLSVLSVSFAGSVSPIKSLTLITKLIFLASL